MAEEHRPTATTEPGYTFSGSGRYAFMQLFVEAMDGIDDEMKALGFVSIDQNHANRLAEGHPLFPSTPGPRVVANQISPPDFLAIAAIVQDPIVKGAVEAVAAKFFEVILPRITSVFARAKKEADIQYPTTISSAFFFSVEQVQITAVAIIEDDVERQIALKLFPLAFERGIDWILSNGKQGRYMTIFIRHGNIDGFPIVSDQLVDYRAHRS